MVTVIVINIGTIGKGRRQRDSLFSGISGRVGGCTETVEEL